MNCSSSRDGHVLDQLLVDFTFTEFKRQFFNHLWYPSGTSNKQDVTDIIFRQLSLGEGCLYWLHGFIKNRPAYLFEFSSCQSFIEILIFIKRLNVDISGHHATTQLNFSTTASCSQFGPLFLESLSVFDLMLFIGIFIPLLYGPLQKFDVNVLTTQMVITRDSFDIALPLIQLQYGDIERTTTKVVHHDVSSLVWILSVTCAKIKSSCRWLSDDHMAV